MAVLTTRVLQYRSDNGVVKDVTLTVFTPRKTDQDDWECGFQFSPPPNQRTIHVRGVDAIQALLSCLTVARSYIEHPTEERSSWQGMVHAGLPRFAEKPEAYQPPTVPPFEENPGGLEPLAVGILGCPDETGRARALALTVYKPLRADDGTWKCAFVLGSPVDEPVRHGMGDDFIEALLDGLALARATYEAMIPEGWEVPLSDEFLEPTFLPYKEGRSYAMEPTSDPDMPDFSAA
ncbi:DUF6968 family protein [Polyangium sorediatum]|uniref:DUF6968 domain-containing protein n=1 Tax=Polyangium sorediatum TaxID=889274 RepID=A0ABT6NY06_9BACT|nr:hypothetical protein [Polyangium sorediatum]MDI1433226.1 hypothetical protein [Polyangium sorediatum]